MTKVEFPKATMRAFLSELVASSQLAATEIGPFLSTPSLKAIFPSNSSFKFVSPQLAGYSELKANDSKLPALIVVIAATEETNGKKTCPSKFLVILCSLEKFLIKGTVPL